MGYWRSIGFRRDPHTCEHDAPGRWEGDVEHHLDRRASKASYLSYCILAFSTVHRLHVS